MLASIAIKRSYWVTDCELTTKISFFVKRFPVEARKEDVQEEKEHTDASSDSTELATQA